MRIAIILISFATAVAFTGCSGNKLEDKGFSVHSMENSDENNPDGISGDSLSFMTRPGSVLLTGILQFRLTTVYKVNYNKGEKTGFIGSNNFYNNYNELNNTTGNQWNYNIMPGFEAVYGYNMVNISHYDISTQKQKSFFKEPVLIKTFYFPSLSRDTLFHKPVLRNYFMVSVYDYDTNKDGFINLKDLRHFYFFDMNAENQKPLVPANYSVLKSEYDPANDFMYVYAQLDKNNNGQKDEGEEINIFWINLNNPEENGRLY